MEDALVIAPQDLCGAQHDRRPSALRFVTSRIPRIGRERPKAAVGVQSIAVGLGEEAGVPLRLIFEMVLLQVLAGHGVLPEPGRLTVNLLPLEFQRGKPLRGTTISD